VGALAELPKEAVTVDATAQTVSLLVASDVYPVGALYAASYVLLDRAYIHLDAPDAAHFRVTLAWKKPPADPDAIDRLGGEFLNELLSCAWRARIAEDNRAVIESATARALAGAMGAPSLDDLESFDFGDQPLEDPLGIALSWEEKYGKRKPEGEP
jgi:His-Xaa-Ser system protein HxsD